MNMKMKTPKYALSVLMAIMALCLLFGGCGANVMEVPAEGSYSYVNPDETKAETDAGITIDGVLDEAVYQNNNWLYLSNREGGADVAIAMTSYFGEKGMYFVYDVTEGNPIYVNLDRPSYINSGVELHLAPGYVSKMKANSVFEINLLPSGDMTFKKSDGKGGFVNVETTKDMMAVLGASTKGGQLNTEQCNGYCLELFIPWEYMEKFNLDVAAMKSGYVHAGLAHITSFNYAGTDMDVDRYWYSFDVQHGASWSDVYQYFRFDEKGVQGTVPVQLDAGEHYTIDGASAVIPGMQMDVTITPDAGYALKSISINGEEFIGKADFNQDGSVTIRERGVAGGMQISAVAEPVTEGVKTLTGTVVAYKLGGGDLKNITASYKGPTGEKPLELDSKGKFVLTELKQGYYTIILEKEGYEKLTRNFYVNRDMEAELALQYSLFTATGNSWILDDQNQGILRKFGGSGELLTNDSYRKFTISATFRHQEELETAGAADSFTEQRKGFKIAFANGKIWHIDLLKQDGKFYVQYAKHSGEKSMTGWKKIYELNGAEIAKYMGEGIELSVQRDGKYANVYLGGKLIALELLDNACANSAAQLGFEAWMANREVMQIPFKITSATSVNLRNTNFKMKDGWDVSQQYSNLVAMPSGGTGRLTFIDKQGNMSLTVTARDYQNSKDAEGVYPRTDILLVFDNGKQISFGIDAKGTKVQSMYDDSAADKYINTGWKTWGNLTDEEIGALRNEGVAFKVVRYGSEVTLYVGDRMVAVVDLTQNHSGVTEETLATVSIRHYDDAGVRVEIPFALHKTFDTVKLSVDEALAAEKTQYFVGDTVKLQAKDENNYITALTINGKTVTADPDGTYSFTATETEYTITGQVAKTVFQPDSQWDLKQQNDGVISIPNRTGDYASLYTVDNIYRDAGITVKDAAPTFSENGNGNFQMQIRFIFENGKQYQVRLHNTDKDGKYKIQSMGGTDCITGWKWHVDLTAEQTEKLQNSGIQFRVILTDKQAVFYLDGEAVGTYSLSDALKNNGLDADAAAQIHFMMYGNHGQKDLVMPYVLSDGTQIVTVQVENASNGTVQADKLLCTAGETVTITATPASGCVLKSLSVKKDGQTVDIGAVSAAGGQYSFVAQKGSYTVQAVFAAKLQWSLLDSNGTGAYTVEEGKDYVALSTVESIYREAAVTVKDLDPTFNASGNGNFQMQIRFIFANGKQYQVRLHNTDKDGKYKVQNMGGTNCITGWKWLKDLTAAQTQALQTGDGVQLRVVLVGANAELYLDAVKIATVDLSSGGVKENFVAQIRFVMYGNTGATNLEIPCTVGGSVTPIFTFANDTDKKNWDLTQQYEGLATIIGKTKASGGYARILTAASTYRDVAVTVRDQQSGVFKMQIYFTFANGKQFQIRLDNEAGSYRVQNMSSSIISSWKKVHGLTDDQVAKLQGESGIKFRIQISGTNALVYLDNTQVGTLDLSAGIEANATAQITMIMYGNDGVEPITIPFEFG